MSRSERAAALAAAALALALVVGAGGCGTGDRVLQVVDPHDPLLDGLVGWWRFDEGPGSAVAHDASGNGNDGTLMDLDAAAAFTWPLGHDGSNCLEVRGAGYVNVPVSPSIQSISEQVTVAAWIYFEGSVTDTWGTAISRQIARTINQHFHLSIDSGAHPSMWLTTANGTILVTSPPAIDVPRFTWMHLVGTFDGTTSRIYVDGAQVSSQGQTGVIAADDTPVILGGNANEGLGVTERFPGRIDDVMLYRRALSAVEIMQLAER